MKVLFEANLGWLDKHKRSDRMHAFTHLLGLKMKKKYPDLKDFTLANTGEEHDPKLIHLDSIEVKRGARKQGVGSKVMTDLGKYADKHKLRMTLQVAEKNKHSGTTSSGRLRKFYRRHGWTRNFGKTKDYSLSMYASMYRNPKPKTEAIGYKIISMRTMDGAGPMDKITTYHFRHKHGSGQVGIKHAPGKESVVSFSTSTKQPDTRNAINILKTVMKAVRHHIMKEKPKVIGYYARNDEHDRPGHNRREVIYDKMFKGHLKKHKWHEIPNTYGAKGRHRFKKGR